MKKLLRKIAEFPYRLDRIERRMTDFMMLAAGTETRYVRSLGQVEQLSDAEFKVFSQWGEDGVIQYLISRLGIREKCFIEFGVENYREANTRFLLMHDRWSGLVLDGSAQHIATLERDGLPWLYDLHYEAVFITKTISTSLSVNMDSKGHWEF